MSLVDAIQSFDFAILDAIHSAFGGGVSDTVWKVITAFGSGGIFWIALSVLFLLFRRTRKWGLAMGIALFIGVIVGNLFLKNAFARVRPYDVNNMASLIVRAPHDFSYPSGHTMGSLGAALALFHCSKKAGTPAVILALLIMYSRLYLYVHYPTDILGGLLVALGTSLLGYIFAELITARFEPWLDAKLSARRAGKSGGAGGK